MKDQIIVNDDVRLDHKKNELDKILELKKHYVKNARREYKNLVANQICYINNKAANKS